jgi:DNA-binding transcriptional regulator LsrR (DeoR family)
MSAMTYLRDALGDTVKFTGLFAAPLLDANRYDELKSQKLATKAFAESNAIDIVVTSLASSEDEHGYLYRYLDNYDGRDALDRLAGRGWLGDLQLRPYDENGSLAITEGAKPVTLFELEDLVALAHKPAKHVVLLCSPCGHCNKPKTRALLPLMRQSNLHAWNHLVLDAGTARELADSL